MTGAPLFAGSLYGLRYWRVTADERGEWLASPYQGRLWPPGGQWLEAKCPHGHAAPAPGCRCGTHAWHPRRRSAREALGTRATVAGIVEAQGPIEVHEEGLRAARCRPYALIATPGRNAALIRRLAERYDARVIEVAGPGGLLAWCREQNIGMSEQVVADLLGTGGPEERRRARLRAATNDALRVAFALAVAVALVVLGLEVATDPPGDRTVFGRTGEVRTH